MFKLKNNHISNYLANLFEFRLRKEVKSSTYSHFFKIPSNSTYENLDFPTVDPFYGTLFFPLSTLLLSTFIL